MIDNKTKLIEILNKYEKLINENKFEELYSKLEQFKSNNKLFIKDVTEVLYKIGVEPLNYLSEVPKHYLSFSDISSVNIPSHIETIEESAFFNCKNLTSIKIPENVKTIYESAFEYCRNLKTVDFSNATGLVFIKDLAFNRAGLQDIIFPSNLSVIGEASFRENTKLKSVDASKSNLGSIGTRAFAFCSHLKYVHLPKTVYNIDIDAFDMCNPELLIDYDGTLEDWREIKGYYRVDATVRCLGK